MSKKTTKDKMRTFFVVMAEGQIKALCAYKQCADEVYEAFPNAHIEQHIVQDALFEEGKITPYLTEAM